MQLTVSDAIAGLALVFSITSFVFLFRLTRQSKKTDIRPVLVFVFAQGEGWKIQNVGNGPALNVRVWHQYKNQDWSETYQAPPVGQDGAVPVHWLPDPNIDLLRAVYQDFQGNPYCSFCKDDRTGVFDGYVEELPDSDEAAPGRHWWY